MKYRKERWRRVTRFSETIQFVSSFPFLKEPLTFKVSRQITLPRLRVWLGLRCYRSDGKCGWNSALSEVEAWSPCSGRRGYLMYMRWNSPLVPPTVGERKHCRNQCTFPKRKGLKVQVTLRILEQGVGHISPNTISLFSKFCKWRNWNPARLYDIFQFVLEQG